MWFEPTYVLLLLLLFDLMILRGFTCGMISGLGLHSGYFRCESCDYIRINVLTHVMLDHLLRDNVDQLVLE